MGVLWQKARAKIGSIRESDDGVKRKWLIAASSGAMILVLAIWFLFLGIMIPRTDKINPSKEEGVFMGILKNSVILGGASAMEAASRFAVILKNGASGLSKALLRDRTFTVEK